MTQKDPEEKKWVSVEDTGVEILPVSEKEVLKQQLKQHEEAF